MFQKIIVFKLSKYEVNKNSSLGNKVEMQREYIGMMISNWNDERLCSAIIDVPLNTFTENSYQL